MCIWKVSLQIVVEICMELRQKQRYLESKPSDSSRDFKKSVLATPTYADRLHGLHGMALHIQLRQKQRVFGK